MGAAIMVDKVYITKTYLPPIEEYIEYLEGIWDRTQLTNNGPLTRELEDQLKTFFKVKHVFFVCNGTMSLQIAIKALELHGEILTTPFSHVATSSCIAWESCQPVFVDIDPHTLCIDPTLIEESITENTSAILPTHVYGIPCDVEKIEKIAKKHNLKVLYDAAHTFGCSYKGKSLVSYGNISSTSFHATKLFHTVEGGAILTNNDDLAERISHMRYFGLEGPSAFWGLGINGNNSEFHAAMGLCILPRITNLINKRKHICEQYDIHLTRRGISRPTIPEGTQFNFSYYPILLETENDMLNVQDRLNEDYIYPRRYFYPNLTTLPYVNYVDTPVAHDIASRVLCLPLSPYLEDKTIKRISSLINKVVES
jgi:dTDP-4-amino-4,6-dideoxygalactose transaminase